MICEICKDGKDYVSLGIHLTRTHKISHKEYYDTYIKPNTEHKCAYSKCDNDNYPPEDFNKNNLIDNILEPEIVFQAKGCTVYDAGKLY